MTQSDVIETRQPKAGHEAAAGQRGLFLLLFALVLLAAGGLFWLTQPRTGAPAEGSAEVGFARDMIVHHNQAVEMALVLYDRGDNEFLRSIALDMLLTQQGQIGQMQAWLALWGVSFAGADLPMTWMGMPTEGLMPGMATDAQLADLRAASGVDADGLFIDLMIPHHQAGVHMAEAIVASTDVLAVRALAQSMITAQQSEIQALEDIRAMLDASAATPAAIEHPHS